MCNSIKEIIDEKTDLAALNSMGANYRITFGNTSNGHIQKQLGPDMKYLRKHSESNEIKYFGVFLHCSRNRKLQNSELD